MLSWLESNIFVLYVLFLYCMKNNIKFIDAKINQFILNFI